MANKEKAAATEQKQGTFTITATQEKVTKNSVRFAEDVPDGTNADAYVAFIGQIYIQKHSFGGTLAKRVRLTVEVLE